MEMNKKYITGKLKEIRDKRIYQLRKNGKTLASIGNIFNITRGRVHQIYERQKIIVEHIKIIKYE